jgi:hypothetical protein
MDNMTDRELDALLGLASKPKAEPGAAARATARAFAEEGQSNVVVLQPNRKPMAANSNLRWIAALPLAASLAFGIYLGAMGAGSYVLPESLGGGAIAEEDALLSGVEDMEALSDEDVS